MNRKESARNASSARAAAALAIPFAERLEGKYEIGPSGCWLWTGYCYRNGYAAFSWQGKQQLLHRLVYEQLVGPIPDGLVIDHVAARGCVAKNCINPAHLEPVTSGENTRRAMRAACVNGHAFTHENTWMYGGKRYCRTCRRERNRAQRGKAK